MISTLTRCSSGVRASSASLTPTPPAIPANRVNRHKPLIIFNLIEKVEHTVHISLKATTVGNLTSGLGISPSFLTTSVSRRASVIFTLRKFNQYQPLAEPGAPSVEWSHEPHLCVLHPVRCYAKSPIPRNSASCCLTGSTLLQHGLLLAIWFCTVAI